MGNTVADTMCVPKRNGTQRSFVSAFVSRETAATSDEQLRPPLASPAHFVRHRQRRARRRRHNQSVAHAPHGSRAHRFPGVAHLFIRPTSRRPHLSRSRCESAGFARLPLRRRIVVSPLSAHGTKRSRKTACQRRESIPEYARSRSGNSPQANRLRCTQAGGHARA